MKIIWGKRLNVSMSYLYFSRTTLQNKLQIWDMQAHQNKSSPQKYFMFINLWVYFLIIFFWCGNLKFWLFFVKPIWWNETYTIFKKLDLTKIFLILLFMVSNLFDSSLEIQCRIQGYVWAHLYYVKAWFVYSKTILCDTFKQTSRHRHT